jgi:hypothetical protein
MAKRHPAVIITAVMGSYPGSMTIQMIEPINDIARMNLRVNMASPQYGVKALYNHRVI